MLITNFTGPRVSNVQISNLHTIQDIQTIVTYLPNDGIHKGIKRLIASISYSTLQNNSVTH